MFIPLVLRLIDATSNVGVWELTKERHENHNVTMPNNLRMTTSWYEVLSGNVGAEPRRVPSHITGTRRRLQRMLGRVFGPSPTPAPEM